MGLFSKKSISIDEFSNALVDLTFSSYDQKLNELVKEMDEDLKLSNVQLNEILIFFMHASTFAVSTVFEDKNILRDILDKFTENIYYKVSEDIDIQTEFEKLIHERYKLYWDLIAQDDDHKYFDLGLFLGEKVFKDSSSGKILIFNNVMSQLYILQVKSIKEFCMEILNKYKLKM